MTMQATYTEEEWRFDFPEGITITMRDWVEARGLDISVLMQVDIADVFGHPAGTASLDRINIISASAKQGLARDLARRFPSDDVDWSGVIAQVCARATKKWQEGTPAGRLIDVPFVEAGRFLVDPIIDAEGVTLLFADGGAGKSFLAMALALTVAGGVRPLGMLPEKVGPVLYLDWEAEAHTQQARLFALNDGLADFADESGLGNVIYTRMDQSLIQGAKGIRQEILRHGAIFVVVDSLGAARAADPADAASTIAMFNAMRSWQVPVLALDHVTKSSVEGPFAKESPPKHSLGTVTTRNRARMSWRLDHYEPADEDAGYDPVRKLRLTNVKANNARFAPRIGLLARFETDTDGGLLSVSYDTAPAATVLPADSGQMSMPDRILAAVTAADRPLLVGAIIAEVNEDGGPVKPDATIRSSVNKLKRGGRLTELANGFYGLASQHERTTP